MFTLTTEKFSGPLGLLLELIEKEEMDITEISLAKIADEYVALVKQSPEIEPDEIADFLLIAARLLLIKSRALLPYLITDEEEEEIDDLRKQLKLYQEFALASQAIRQRLLANNFSYLPPLSGQRSLQVALPNFTVPLEVNPLVLKEAFLKLLSELASRQEDRLAETKLEPKVSIEERITYIKSLLGRKVKFNFSKIIAQAQSKTELIVSFLAVLELAKQKELNFEQTELFGEIEIRTH